MTTYEDRTTTPPPEQQITVLYVWIATYPNGSEGIISKDMPISDDGLLRHMPLMTSRREVAERMGMIARRVAKESDHGITVRMATYRLVADA